MPREMEIKLRRQANKKGLKGARKNAYIFGTMRKAGWRPKREIRGDKIRSKLKRSTRKAYDAMNKQTWFHNLTRKAQQLYLKKHPKSRYAKRH